MINNIYSKLPWSEFKRLLSIQDFKLNYVDIDNVYWLFGVSGTLRFGSSIVKTTPKGSDQVDFEDNYKNIVSSTKSTSVDSKLEVLKGNVAKHKIITVCGERDNINTTVTGEDLWDGEATTIPIPSADGEQMSMVSTNTSDTLNGSGTRSVCIHYLNGLGAECIEYVNMNGTTPVHTVATDIKFVGAIHSLTVGSNFSPKGVISIYKKDSSTKIYNHINPGENSSLTCQYMVPAGHKLYLQGWRAMNSKDKRVSVRIRSMDHLGTPLPNIFLIKDTVRLFLDSTGELPLYDVIPALSIIKISVWADQDAAECSGSFWGYLIQD